MKKLVVQNLLKVWLCAMVSFMTVTLYAQGNSFKVSGTVKDNTGELVIGATVIDTKTKNGCVTDVDGNFSLEVTPNSSIKVSFIGYKSQTIAIKAEQKVYNVILQSDNVLIDELVVVGYGVKKKQTLTGAVSAVNTKDIVSTKNESLQNMLTGKIAGLRVVQNSSEPGAFNTSMDIRGLGNPLVIIDGIPRDNMARVDPEDVESISVLKDASASIYGVRAANGVILVTTKRGKEGKVKLSYDGTIGFQDRAVRAEQVSAREYMTMVNEALVNSGGSIKYSEDDILATERGDDPYNHSYLNWAN